MTGRNRRTLGLADRTRDFRHIHKDNFDEILAYSRPYLKFAVADTLRGQGLMQVELDFKALDDFHPDQIVRNVPQLVAEQERRKRLEVLLGMLGSDPLLEERLQEIVDNPGQAPASFWRRWLDVRREATRDERRPRERSPSPPRQLPLPSRRPKVPVCSMRSPKTRGSGATKSSATSSSRDCASWHASSRAATCFRCTPVTSKA